MAVVVSQMARPSSLTKARAKALLTELVEGFSRRSFQVKLERLIARYETPSAKDIHHLTGRRELAFTVQRHIMPTYGFSPDEVGLIEMKAEVRAFLHDEQVVIISRDIRSALRLPQMALLNADWDEVDPLESDMGATTAAAAALCCRDRSRTPPSRQTDSAVLAGTCVAAGSVKPLNDLKIKVVNAADKGHVTVTVSRCGSMRPTVKEVKDAIVNRFGSNGASDLELVIPNGDIYGIRLDSDVVRLDRVLAVGVDIAAAGA